MDCPRIPKKGEVSEPSAVMQSIWLPHISSNENFFRKFVKKIEKKVGNSKIVNTLYNFQQAYLHKKVASIYQESIHTNINEK